MAAGEVQEMSEIRFSGVVVARWAEDYGLTGDEAWRMARASAELRKIMMDHYGASTRQQFTDRYVAEPGEMAIDDLTEEIDRARRDRGEPGDVFQVVVDKFPKPEPTPPGVVRMAALHYKQGSLTEAEMDELEDLEAKYAHWDG
jgi:hypothetical protein